MAFPPKPTNSVGRPPKTNTPNQPIQPGVGGIEQIDGYQKRTKTGKVVQVQPHERANNEAATHVLVQPGRPPVSGRPGSFPNGRGIPGFWAKPIETPLPDAPVDPLDSVAKSDGKPPEKKKVNPLDESGQQDKAKLVVDALAELLKKKAEADGPKRVSSPSRQLKPK